MIPKVARLSVLIIAPLMSGCLTVAETRKDHDKIRTALNTLYEDQIMDNLIRAANGLPFVQLDYTNATTTVTVSENGEVGTNPNVQSTRARSLPGKVVQLTRMFANPWTFDAKVGNTNQITLTANPVTNSNGVYDAYLQFLTNPGSLVVSCDPPPPGRAHISRQWQGKYFWVPVEYRYLFLQLALVTTFQRGKPLQRTEAFFTVTPHGVGDPVAGDPPISFLDIKLDGPVPNDRGHIEFTVDGKPVVFDVERPEQQTPGPRPAQTDKLVIRFDPAKAGNAFKDVNDLKARLPLPAKLYLDHSRPEPPVTDDLLRSLQFSLEQIRLNQLRPPLN